MKVVLKNLFLMALAMILSLTAFAQNGKHHDRGPGMSLNRMADELKLTEAQQAKIEAIETKYTAERKALREEASQDREEQRAAMKELMEKQRTEIEAVLTAEQKATLQARKEEMKEKHQERRTERKEMGAEMKAYRQANIDPVMRAQRAKLEAKLSAEDKAVIAALRAKKEQAKQRFERNRDQEMTPEMREKMRAQREARREEFSKDRETVKALVEKYGKDIDQLFAEVAAQQEGWKKDMREIAEKYRPADKGERPEGRGHRSGKGKKGHKGAGHNRPEGMHKAHFLLMDPASGNAESSNATPTATIANVKVYPNPAVDRNTLEYTVQEAGQITVELRSKEGSLIKVLSTERKEKGTYTLNVDLSALQGGVYYLTITDAGGTISEKFVVSR